MAAEHWEIRPPPQSNSAAGPRLPSTTTTATGEGLWAVGEPLTQRAGASSHLIHVATLDTIAYSTACLRFSVLEGECQLLVCLMCNLYACWHVKLLLRDKNNSFCLCFFYYYFCISGVIVFRIVGLCENLQYGDTI